MSTLTVGTISEKVTDAGVAVDGVTLKDGGATFTSAVGITGNTTVTSGNLIIGTNGNGIDFSATTDSGGMSNELLDDYEEGSWTPDVGGNATYTTQLGRYTKIGNHVLAQFDMTISVLGTGSSAQINGLPFAQENVMVASGSVAFFSGVASNVYYLSFYVINNSTTAYMTGITSAGGTISNTIPTFQNGARVNGMVSYRTG